MRIIVVCSDLGVRVPGEKGASIHLSAITNAFHDLGHEVLLIGVAGHGEPGIRADTLLFAHPGRSVGLEREQRKLAFTARLASEAAAVVKSFAPEVIYERLSLFGTAGSQLADLCGATHVVEVNALVAEEEATWRGLHLRQIAAECEHKALSHAALRVAVSAEVAHDVERVAPGPATIVVANGVDTQLFAVMPTKEIARQQLGIGAAERVVVFTGALRPWHGVDVAIRALADMSQDTTLLVAGSGEIQPDLERLATEIGVATRVRWLGHVPHAAMPNVLAAGDVAVAPYPTLAGFGFSPLKLFEYLAAGIPVVGSDIGQVTEALANGRFGTLVEAGDVDAFRAALQTVIGDPNAAARASHAREFALSNHAWTDRAQRILAEAANHHTHLEKASTS